MVIDEEAADHPVAVAVLAAVAIVLEAGEDDDDHSRRVFGAPHANTITRPADNIVAGIGGTTGCC